jgi:hypothetical protein
VAEGEVAQGWWTHPSSHASEEVGVQLEEGFDGGGAEDAEDVDPGGRRHRAIFFRAGLLFDEMHCACETSLMAISQTNLIVASPSPVHCNI